MKTLKTSMLMKVIHGNLYLALAIKIRYIKRKLKTRIVALKLSIDLLRWLQLYMHLIKMIQEKMTSKMSLITVLPIKQIIHLRRKDHRNRGN